MILILFTEFLFCGCITFRDIGDQLSHDITNISHTAVSSVGSFFLDHNRFTKALMECFVPPIS